MEIVQLQVFTAGFNDSVESDDKNDVGDLTWAPMDEDDFSDKSETMLDDDQSMSSVRTNHTFGCFDLKIQNIYIFSFRLCSNNFVSMFSSLGSGNSILIL